MLATWLETTLDALLATAEGGVARLVVPAPQRKGHLRRRKHCANATT